MISKRGQISSGVMLGVGTIVFLFLIIAVFTLNRNVELKDTQEYIEKRNECLKISNYINSVFSAGPGSQVETHTDFLITIFNESIISIQTIGEVNESGNPEPQIAFVASEAGPTGEDFYDSVNANFDPQPDWYKACFSGLSGPGCDWSGTSWMETEIPNNISLLMDNLDSYTTIYLEDPTIYYGNDYISKLETWVAKGNALILSEHVMCRESGGTYPEDDYRCNPPGSSGDSWGIFNATLSQRGNAWGFSSNWNVEIIDTYEGIDLALGERISVEERSYIQGTNITDFHELGRYRNSFWLWDSRNQPSIAYWMYGDGIIFYFSDFYINYISPSGKEFSEVLKDLITNAYYLIYRPEVESDVTCTFSAFVPYQQTTGDIIIRNVDNYIWIFGANETQ